MRKPLLPITIVTLLLVACGSSAQSSDTPAPTATPTATDAPPTPSSTLAPTPSPSPSPSPTLTLTLTLTLTPMPTNAAPVISGLDDQSIADGERFPALKLDDYVTDNNHADRDITWSYAGNVELQPRIINVKGEFSVQVPSAAWTGSETLVLTACDPEGLCDAVEVVFSVNSENDAPVVQVEDQSVLPGDSFTAIALDEHVQDVDNAPDEIAWSFAGDDELDLNVVDGVLTLRAKDAAWRGSETLQFQACDVGGACGSQEVTFTVLSESDLVVTYVGNEGFLIVSAGKKILVDALHRYQISPETLALLENAQPPFDGVDLILVTHNDQDHFDPALVGRYLANNPQALFVATYQAVADLQAEYAGWDEIQERVTSVRLEPQGSLQQTFNGVPLEIIELPHGEPSLQVPHNIGFLITLGEHKLLHTGDLVPAAVDLPYLQVYDLPDKQIDVLFMAHLMLLDQDYHDLLEQAFPARYLIPMHLDPVRDRLNFSRIRDYFPEAIFFRAELSSWLMPVEEPQAALGADQDIVGEEVSFVTEDGVKIAATLFGEGDVAVILLHMGAGNATQKSWQPFAKLIAQQGLAALTVDFRGRGLSEGTLNVLALIRDARAAAEFLHSRGFERLACVGASMGGSTCIQLAGEIPLEGLIVVSSPLTRTAPKDLAQPALPKLFVYGSRDGVIAGSMDAMYRMASGPKEQVVYDSAAHGTDLFRTPYEDDFRQQLLNFLTDLTGLTEEVHFSTDDGFELAGTLFGSGETALLFLHQGRGNVTQKSWHPFAQLVAENGFTALTFDFRGRGLSQGERIDESRLIDDTRAAAAFLRERGYERIVCVGAAHWGGESCIRLALETDIAGLVILSNLMRPDSPGTPVRSQDLAQLTQPKLFIYGAQESTNIQEAMTQVYRLCPEPKKLITYASAALGTNLFRSPYADDLRQQLLDFLQDLTR